MSVTAHAPRSTWAAAHRTVLVFLVLAVALAAALGLVAARVFTGSDPISTTSVITPAGDGCSLALPGTAC
jgi:hypothetical protein